MAPSVEFGARVVDMPVPHLSYARSILPHTGLAGFEIKPLGQKRKGPVHVAPVPSLTIKKTCGCVTVPTPCGARPNSPSAARQTSHLGLPLHMRTTSFR